MRLWLGRPRTEAGDRAPYLAALVVSSRTRSTPGSAVPYESVVGNARRRKVALNFTLRLAAHVLWNYHDNPIFYPAQSLYADWLPVTQDGESRRWHNRTPTFAASLPQRVGDPQGSFSQMDGSTSKACKEEGHYVLPAFHISTYSGLVPHVLWRCLVWVFANLESHLVSANVLARLVCSLENASVPPFVN